MERGLIWIFLPRDCAILEWDDALGGAGPAASLWSAELAIPMRALTAQFDPATEWRVNFFRVEGPREPRFYSAWRATNTPAPNFHVPEAFGKLRFGR